MAATPLFGMMFVLIICALPFLFVLAVIVLTRSGGSKKSQSMADEDAQAYQDLHHGFQRMEDRIEALETILMDKDRHRSRDVRSNSDSFE